MAETKKTAEKSAKPAKKASAAKVKAPKEPKAAASDASNIEAAVFDMEGKESGTVSLPGSVFGLSWNADLVHQVITSMMTDARVPYAHTKMRGEVAGTGKKPWKQKGTGRARHGSRRSPIWVGGGVAHGPRNDKNFDRKVNKKMKTKALFTILSKKLRDGEILFVKNIELSEPKTKNAHSLLSRVSKVKGFEALSTKKNNAALVVLPEISENVKRGFQNFGNIELSETRNINPLTLANYKYLVIASPEASLVTLESRGARS